MEFLLENILNLLGFLVGLAIGIMSFIGFKNTGSPTLFRLTIAFFSISIGFFCYLDRIHGRRPHCKSRTY